MPAREEPAVWADSDIRADADGAFGVKKAAVIDERAVTYMHIVPGDESLTSEDADVAESYPAGT